MVWIGLCLLPPLLLAVLNRLIRRGLQAPRVVEEAEPQGLSYTAVRFPTSGGKQLFAWWIAGPEKAPTVILLHGWGGNAQMMLPLVPALHQAGLGLLLVDARCHGRSEGDSFASLPRFAEDLESALAWLRTQQGGDLSVGVVGHSVGAGAALLAASRGEEITAVVSLAAFAHPRAMMQRWLGQKGVPSWLIRYILAYVQHTIGHRFDDIAPVHTITRVRCPVLIVHGESDATVPVSEAIAIHAEAPAGRARLLLVPGDHDETEALMTVMGEVVAFLQASLRQTPAAAELA